MIVEIFGKRIQAYLRASGYQQKELAAVLGINHKVLSRKLHGTDNSYFTHREIHDVLLTLLNWQALTKREDLLDLLAEAEIDPAAIFRASEWQEEPLKTLARRQPAPVTALDHVTPRPNLRVPIGQLIGRAWALTRLRQLLQGEGARLITLIGPGGSGKTRLAQHVAIEMLDTFAQRVWFVPFLGVSDPELIPLTIAQVLNIKSASNQPLLQSIFTYLSHRQALLVLDNLEHLPEASSIVEELLSAAPNLKILITSRIVLHVAGEHEFSVPPLDLPDLALASRMDVAELAGYGAIQLFVERARAVLPEFALTSANGELIARICACVDGLPLALELAAARVKLLPPAMLLERLSKARLPLLTRVSRFAGKQAADRHQTLRDTIQWSYDLLSPEEQVWFRRLGIFSEGWTLESFEMMMHELAPPEQEPLAELSPLDLLTRLANHSLLARVHAVQGYARFSMLSTLREYALEHLERYGETERTRDWHACYFLGKAERGELELRGPGQLRALARLHDASANLRAALEWSLARARAGQGIAATLSPHGLAQQVASCRTLSSHPLLTTEVSAHEIVLRLATALRAYWEWQGALSEARSWLNAALELPLAENAGPTLLAARARALSEAARLAHLQNEPEQALQLVAESIALWQELNDPPGLASAFFHRAWALHGKGEYEAAKEVYQEALTWISPASDTWLYAQILLCQAAAFAFTSDFPQARLLYTRCRQLFEQVGDKAAIADTWKDEGGILIIAGEVDEAIHCLLTSIQICRELDHKEYITTALHWLSFAFGLRETPDPASASLNSARIQGAAENLMATIGMTHWADTTPFIQAVRQYICSRVSPEQWQAALNEGRALPLNQALEMVTRLATQPDQ